MDNHFKRTQFLILLACIYLFILGWWLSINYLGVHSDFETYYFNWTYGLIALLTGSFSIFLSIKKWGGYKSHIGKALIFLGAGLISQWFGLQIWTYYNLALKIEVPYPSFADIGYFGLIPFYILAALMIAKVSGAKFSLKTTRGKIIAIIIPFFTLLTAYFIFLNNIGFDSENFIKTFFDIGYPLGEIIPAAISIFILSLSNNLLGGIMRRRIQFLAFAFFFQFMTEYLFLYNSGLGTYVNGGLNDIMYATSYMIMGIAIYLFAEKI